MSTRKNGQNTAQTLRKQLMEQAHKVVEYKLHRALGTETDLEHHLVDDKTLDELWNIIVPMIQKSSDISELEANTTKDVIQLLKDGVISIADAKDLMEMVRVKIEVDNFDLIKAIAEAQQQKQIDC